eukprot:6502_1
MEHTIKQLHLYLQHRNSSKEIEIDWNKIWNDLLKNANNLRDLILISRQFGINSLDDIIQFIIKIFECCLQCGSITSINLAFKFASAILLLDNIAFLKAIIPCLLNSCQHMENYNNPQSMDYNIFFQYIKFIYMNNKCKTLDIWNDKSYRQRCISLIFNHNDNNNEISYRHLCLLLPWYSLYFQDLLPFISKLYQPNPSKTTVIESILQHGNIKYITDINNAINTLDNTTHIKSIISILIHNKNFNYNNFNMLHFNKLVRVVSKTKTDNVDVLLLFFEKLCFKYSLYTINNEQFNTHMTAMLANYPKCKFKFKPIQNIIQKSTPKMLDDNILISTLIGVVALSIVLWLNTIAARSLNNPRIMDLNHSSQYLPDIIHDNFSVYFWKNNSFQFHIYSDTILIIQIGVGVMVLTVCYPQPFHFVRLYLKMYCILLLMRVITFTVTTLPTAVNECKELSAKIVLQDVPPTFFCNDFIFSGHTTTSWLLMILYYLHIYKTSNCYIYWYESIFVQSYKKWLVN